MCRGRELDREMDRPSWGDSADNAAKYRYNSRYPYFLKLLFTPTNEQISTANKRIATGDLAGAIASSYTLTEHLLKLILREAGVAFNENEGDIRALYKLVREPAQSKSGW